MTISQTYNRLNINEKINSRDNRNALNINHLFSINLSDFNNGRGSATDQPRRPKNNFLRWGLYHK